MDNKIDLDRIISKYETYVRIKQPYNTEPIFLKENIKLMMVDFGKELLKIASENAKIKSVYRQSCTRASETEYVGSSVDKESILDTIKSV